MKTVALLLIGVAGLACSPLGAIEPPRGSLLELHSCEVYAGGCIVSSQATLEGRYMARAWKFTGGAFEDTPLAGLDLAVVQSSTDNLATPTANAGQGIVYLPASATPAQRNALLDWLKATQPGLDPNRLLTRIVPLRFETSETGIRFSAGKFLAISTASLESCPTGACGEALWYTPRSPATVFTVAVNRSAAINEPLLGVKWQDAGKRSVFLGRFGEPAPAKKLYVSLADFCGPTGKLF